MDWTTEQKRAELLRQPWTVLVTKEDGELVARVKELQGVIGTGSNERELQADLMASLSAVIETMLACGDPIPMPLGRIVPWEKGASPVGARRNLVFRGHGALFEELRASAGPALQYAVR
ncbi:MAG: hypothetical protein HEQ38_05050 [Gemmatimonas sp.]|nr:hypothetical protein [Gemmatimonas sp.]